jgi:hypothetical protein
MKSEIVRLLREAGVEGALDWRDILVTHAIAPVPSIKTATNHTAWTRGFNLTLLSNGQPEHFVKCRPAGDPVLAWDTAIRSCLAGRRPESVSVASVRQVTSDRITIQVSEFLRGPHSGRIVGSQTTADYLATLDKALMGASLLADLALRAGLLPAEPSSINLADAGSDALADVASLGGLGDHERGALEAALVAAGEVPTRPQHGDYWWQNLLTVEGDLWAIDFDSYGDIRIPLFDDLTLALTTMGLRAGDNVQGLERLLSTSEEAQGCRELLTRRAALEGLAESQLNGVFVYYLIFMAWTVHRRGGIGFATPHVAVARRAAEHLANGGSLLPAR